MKILRLLVVGLFFAEATRADDLDNAPFGLRFQAALTRFSRYPDVAGVAGASAAAEWGSSANPAGSAWLALGGVSPQYSLIAFDNGTDIHVGSVSYSTDTEQAGVFQPSLGYATSNRAPTRDGLLFEYDALFAELQWAKKLSEKTAIGVNLNFADSQLSMSPAFTSDAQTYGIRLGCLHQVADKFRFGFAIDYAATRSSTSVVGMGVMEDVLHQLLVRQGIAWEYAERSRVYLDYQYGNFNDDTGSLAVHRVYLGVDHMVAEFLAVRAGTVVDHFGNAAFTIGVGIFPSERVFIDIAYQYRMFPEVEREFGRSQGFAFSVSVSF